MILAIDGYEANAPERVGIGRYAAELISALFRNSEITAAFSTVRVYTPDPPGAHLPIPTDRWEYVRVMPRRLWTFAGLPLRLALDRPAADVVFSPTHYIPRWIKTPRVCAIMDVSYLIYPELFRPQDLHKLIHWTAYSARHAAKIITISEFSKRAIIEAYRVTPDDVVVAYPALPETVGSAHMAEHATLSQHTKRYILSVGTLQPRKNFVRLIEAFSKLKGPDIDLIIVGKKGWMYEDILAAPARYGVEGRVIFKDFVSDSELATLYRHAEAFALPSLYEGFGLPVLEAMTHGTPVVVSTTSSLPEIAGAAGIGVDPENTDSIVRGLTTAITLSPADRKKRVADGRKLAAGFRWDTAADRVMRALADVAGKGSV